ncbi:unnamed protein product [Parnassius apollo]|uniref:(apollo) hypothetical protein n=1 Tax=Parnassius apollo TaxID=110799 RepID=A0A8S3WBR3_PARAO|nr:unnamed protein product [Parnassius apollo]
MINNYIHSLVQDIGSESPDLCIFGENLRSREENLSFIAHDEKDLPVCLQTQNLLSKNSPSGVKLTAYSSPKKLVITSDVKVTSTAKITSTRKKEQIKKKILGAETIRDSALHMKLYPKPKKTNAKQDNILKEIEINNVQPKTSNKIQNRKRKSKKKKRKLDRYVLESSSENSDIMSVVDTENSENESMEDFIKNIY